MLLATLLTCAGVVVVWAGPAAAATDASNFTFEISGTTATIASYDASGPKDVVIPATATVDGTTYTVTAIGNAAFFDKQLTSVTIPDSVTTIGPAAFQSNQLTSLIIPDSVTAIGFSAFLTNQLTSLTIPGSLTTIEDYVFQNNRLTSVTIPDSVTTISDRAFQGNQLTSVTIPDSVTTIGYYAFDENADLGSVLFEGNAPTTVGDAGNGESFDTASGSLVLTYQTGATGFTTPTWHGYTTQAPAQAPVVTTDPTDVSADAGADAVFTAEASGVPAPTVQWQVNMGAGFTDLSDETSTTLTLAEVSLDMEGNTYRAVFSNTSGPDAITSAATLTVSPLTDGYFSFTTSGTTATITGYSNSGPRDIVIPSTVTADGTTYAVTAIGDLAFLGSALTSVVIPNSVIAIGDNAFSGNQLVTVTIPDSVTTIGEEAFFANQLATVKIGDSVTSIGRSAFDHNELTTVTIPDSVATIGYGAFNANQLTTITIGNSVVTIGDFAFYGNQLTTVAIPDSVTTIGEAAFYENTLTSVTLGSSVTTIGDGAFQSNQLASITVPDSVTTIGVFAFGNNQLTSVTVPDAVTAIGNYAFYRNKLASVTIGESVKTIGDGAFDSNPDLRSVVFTGDAPTTITDAGASAESFDTDGGPLVVTYFLAATGFDTPVWHGYTTQVASVSGLAPTITGQAKVGQVLTAHSGPVNPADATLTYQWLADGDPIVGATRSTYTLGTSQTGEVITVTMTATSQGLEPQSETSDPTTRVTTDATPGTPIDAGSPVVDSGTSTDSGTATSSGASTPAAAELPNTGAGSPAPLTIALTLTCAGALLLTAARRRELE